ncbi:uncharacterized protein LOC134820958 [Bolinopsis microptera]|uniref:uncharacterized protein LOC134820958 n=1 Tax=Bolinopsis microptera TaxID=2820187 RepID=UPI00307A0F30
MAPKPIWGAISSYFYPEVDEPQTALSPVPAANDNIDEDGWMLVGPKRAPSPDADEVGSVIMVNHGCESDDEEPCSKRICEEQQLENVSEKEHVVKHVKQLNLVEQMLFQHTAAASAQRATNPKNSWKARNSTFNKTKQNRMRSANRNPGRRSC